MCGEEGSCGNEKFGFKGNVSSESVLQTPGALFICAPAGFVTTQLIIYTEQDSHLFMKVTTLNVTVGGKLCDSRTIISLFPI